MKILKKLLVGGIISTLLGCILFLVGCAGKGFDWSFLSNVQIQQIEYVESAEKNITDIHLSFKTTDFTIGFDENAENISISYPQRQNKKGENISTIQIEETENSLTITEKQKPSFIMFNFTDPIVTVTIPTSRVCALSIQGSTGDVALNNGGVFSNLTVKVSTGDVHLNNVQAEALQATASTGDIHLSNIQTDELHATASTGDITINTVDVTNSVSVQTSTGDISLKRVTANSLSAKADTGDVKLTGATITDALKVETDTGDISFAENITANNITITADTGDLKAKNALIDGKILSITTDTGDVNATLVATKHDYATTVKTDTGSKNISSNLENVLDGLISPTRTLKVKTDTGDIKIYFPAEN